MSDPSAGTQTVTRLRRDFSIEMTGKDAAALRASSSLLPRGTRVNVTYLAAEDLPLRLDAAHTARSVGLVPVPHIAARRLRSRGELEEYLGALQSAGLSDEIFVVGGDPHAAEGPYGSALDVIETGVLREFGVHRVGVSGYPDGHPNIRDVDLHAALLDKAAALSAQGLAASITTQFGFDEKPVLEWIARVREGGVALPIRVGVPGPAGVKRLLSFASRFGVASSAGIVKKYGLSLTQLMGTAGPDRFIDALGAGYREGTHGEMHLHFYPFGGIAATAEWIRDHRPA